MFVPGSPLTALWLSRSRAGHLTTGVAGTRDLLPTLCSPAVGRCDLAYGIATQDTFPSWCVSCLFVLFAFRRASESFAPFSFVHTCDSFLAYLHVPTALTACLTGIRRGWMITQNATTVWERWDDRINLDSSSRNHVM